MALGALLAIPSCTVRPKPVGMLCLIQVFHGRNRSLTEPVRSLGFFSQVDVEMLVELLKFISRTSFSQCKQRQRPPSSCREVLSSVPYRSKLQPARVGSCRIRHFDVPVRLATSFLHTRQAGDLTFAQTGLNNRRNNLRLVLSQWTNHVFQRQLRLATGSRW